ncbi:LptE family protein [bacterium]|nr:LptE family protein [bacterium]
MNDPDATPDRRARCRRAFPPARTVGAAAVLALTALLIRCGAYSFSGASLPPHLKTVAIPLFENRTPEFGIDQTLTDAVIEAVTRDNTLKIAEPASADCILRCTLNRVEDRAGQYNQNEEASTFRVTLSVQAVFEDMRKRVVIWQGPFTAFGNYSEDRDAGIDEAVDKLKTEIVNRMVSNW